MGLFNTLKDKAIADRQRIVLPEGTEPRTLQAANQVITDGVADIIPPYDKIPRFCAYRTLVPLSIWGVKSSIKSTIVEPILNIPSSSPFWIAMGVAEV